MNTPARFLRRLSILFRRDRFHADLEEEMSFHRDQAAQDLQSSGMSPDEAAYAARRNFGNDVRLHERSHEVVGFRIESVAQDLRYALRQLWANPAFTVVIVLTLALSIGANSAIFSVIDSVLLRSLPYAQPDRLVRVFLSSKSFPRFPLNPFDLRDFRARNQSFESIAGYTRSDVQLSGSGDAVRLSGVGVTSGYFHVLGIQPELGREFDEKAEIPGNGLQILLSDRIWRTRFHASPDILGQKITIDMQPFTVVGIMPPGTRHPGNEYHPLAYGNDVDAWWPFAFNGNPENRGSHYLEVIARLKPGVTEAQASAEMNAIMQELGREHPGDKGWQVFIVPLYTEIVGASQRMLLVLLGAVAMVLLIACANAANLLLARASARRREIAVRLALGAPRSRLIRQLLTESLVISFLGGALGLALALVGVRVLVSLLPSDFPRLHDIHVSVPVFAFTLIVSLATGILFGLAPALQASRTDPRQGLQQGGRGTASSHDRGRLRSALVISEVSLACVLLVGAGLMLRSLLNLMHLDPGFRQDHVLTASLSLPHQKYKEDKSLIQFTDQLVTELGALPGVESAGAGSDLPWSGYDDNSGFNLEGKQPVVADGYHARYHMATAGYFRALGTPLLRGRFFTAADKDKARKVVIINQAMAAKYWPGDDALGKRITFEDSPKEDDWLTIVGIVADVKDKPGSPGAEAAFWWPYLQQPASDISLVVRTQSDPQLLIDAVRNEVRRLDPELAIANIQLMDQVVSSSVATPRFVFVLVGLFAGLAFLLAAIGTYGVISYSVSQRTPEFGLRMALGAQRYDVLLAVLLQAGRLVFAGTAIGIALALIFARVLKSLIYNVSPTDPLTFVTVTLTVISVAVVACYIPARRATRADPMVTLRAE